MIEASAPLMCNSAPDEDSGAVGTVDDPLGVPETIFKSEI